MLVVARSVSKMSQSSVETIAEKYFHSLNPIAERICIDVAATRDAYENLWHTLSYKDRSQVVDETIIHPEAVLKYSFYPQCESEVEYYPRLRLQTGDKYVTDYEGGKGLGLAWRDEHSAPFTWMTQSQLNLCIIDEAEPVRKCQNTTVNIPVTNKHKTSPHKRINAPQSNVSFIDPPNVVLGGSSKLVSAISSKLKFPPKSGTGEDNLLTKIKNKTVVLRIQSSKSTASNMNGDSSVHTNEADRETLVQSKNNCAVIPSSKLPKSGGGKVVISKPRTPPPPPPCKQKPLTVSSPHTDSEKMALLQESPADELAGQQSPKCDCDVTHSGGSLDSVDNFHIELKIPSKSDTVPKTGFDFLDNW